MSYLALFQGCATGASLIMAIGPQNAFVLKQGLLKNHVWTTALFCALMDASLIFIGVGGLGELITSRPLLLFIAKWGGALFLFGYGLRAFRSAFRLKALKTDKGPSRPSLKETILTLAAVSLLNPHVYLDTVVLLGSIGSQFPLQERSFFAAGAMMASCLWFTGLCYGARYLQRFFENPLAWKILDGLVGCLMWGIALSLIFS